MFHRVGFKTRKGTSASSCTVNQIQEDARVECKINDKEELSRSLHWRTQQHQPKAGASVTRRGDDGKDKKLESKGTYKGS